MARLLIISGVHEYKKEPTAENVQEFMTWDRDNPFSIASSLAWARENARIIREVISAEMWERMNFYHLWVQDDEARGVLREPPQRVLRPGAARSTNSSTGSPTPP